MSGSAQDMSLAKDELEEDLGISRNLLTRRLKSLVTSGVIERVAYQQRPSDTFTV
jgi:DNA-binding HxlR family transcriptional regulator